MKSALSPALGREMAKHGCVKSSREFSRANTVFDARFLMRQRKPLHEGNGCIDAPFCERNPRGAAITRAEPQ